MGYFILQINAILTSVPGNFVYHLVISFCIAWCLQATFSQWTPRKTLSLQRIISGYFLLIAIQIALFFISSVANPGFSKPEDILPPLDRAITALSFLIILWLWVFPNPHRRADLLCVFVSLITIVFFFTTLAGWQERNPDLFFNSSLLSPMWEVFTLAISFMALLLLIIKKPPHWQIGISFFIINILGHFLAILFPILDAHYLGIVRLTQLVTYPLLFSLSQPIREQDSQSPKMIVSPPLLSSSPFPSTSLIACWLSIQKNRLNSPAAVLSQFFRESFNADDCLIITASNTNDMFILWYPNPSLDSSKQNTQATNPLFAEVSLSKKQLPLISHALWKNKTLILPADNNAQDMLTLKSITHQESNAHLLGIPIRSEEGHFTAAILTRSVSPWQNEEEERAVLLAQWLTNLSQTPSETSSQLSEVSKDDEQAQEQLIQAQQKIEELQALIDQQTQRLTRLPKLEQKIVSLQETITSSKNQIFDLQQTIAHAQGKNEELEKITAQAKQELKQIPELKQQLLSAQEENLFINQAIEQKNKTIQELIIKIEAEKSSIEKHFSQKKLEEKKVLQRYEEALHQVQEQQNKIEQYEKDLYSAKENIDDYKKQVYNTEQQALETKEKMTQQTTQQMTDFAASAQELRYPMSTILDYSDLLLDESVGALGALQKKFLERVKDSIKQLDERVTQLINNTILGSDKMSITPKFLDLNTSIDRAIAIFDSDIQEKNLTVDIQGIEASQSIQLDKDAMHQILVNLLRHSIQISPPSGIVSIKNNIQEDESSKRLLIQISDNGDAIPQIELPDVFSPFYRPSYMIASRSGESEMGPSIAKTLIEALKGRIWIDSEEKKGNTFSFILPMLTPNSKTEGIAIR